MTTTGKSKVKRFMRSTKSVGVDLMKNHYGIMLKLFQLLNGVWSCSYYNKVFIGLYNKVKAHVLILLGHGIQICREINGDILQSLKMSMYTLKGKNYLFKLLQERKWIIFFIPKGFDLLQQDKKRFESGSIQISLAFENNSFGFEKRLTLKKSCYQLKIHEKRKRLSICSDGSPDIKR